MGNCRSCESTSIAISTSTVKLILPDGQLQEFSHPVKVSGVLKNYSSTLMICDSDEVEVGELVRGLDGDEEMQVGQLYFVLPVKMSKHRIQATDMAALAVKASMALGMRSGGVGDGHYLRRRYCSGRPLKAADPLVFSPTMEIKCRRSVIDVERRNGGGGIGREFVRKRRRRGGGGGRGFGRSLSVIMEE